MGQDGDQATGGQETYKQSFILETEGEDCLICSTGGRGAIGRPGCIYDIVCKTCQEHAPSKVPDQEYDEVGEAKDQTTRAGGRQGQGEVGKPCISLYHGESGYSAYHRGLGQRQGLAEKRKKNPL